MQKMNKRCSLYPGAYEPSFQRGSVVRVSPVRLWDVFSLSPHNRSGRPGSHLYSTPGSRTPASLNPIGGGTQHDLFTVSWWTSLMSFDRHGLRPTSRCLARTTWFIGHVFSLFNRQDKPASPKAPMTFAAHQRHAGIRIDKGNAEHPHQWGFFRTHNSAIDNRLYVL